MTRPNPCAAANRDPVAGSDYPARRIGRLPRLEARLRPPTASPSTSLRSVLFVEQIVCYRGTIEKCKRQTPPARKLAGSTTRPNSSKQNQANPSKIAWIYLVLFVRFGTYQWVTAEKIKNSFSPSPPRSRTGSIPRQGKGIARSSDFRKEIACAF